MQHLEQVDRFEAAYNFRWGGWWAGGLVGWCGWWAGGLVGWWAGGLVGGLGSRALWLMCRGRWPAAPSTTTHTTTHHPPPDPPPCTPARRFEEPGGANIISHPRVIEGAVRKEESKRKRQREAKKQRQAEEEAARAEAVKRLKGEKKRDIEGRLGRLQQVGGAGGALGACRGWWAAQERLARSGACRHTPGRAAGGCSAWRAARPPPLPPTPTRAVITPLHAPPCRWRAAACPPAARWTSCWRGSLTLRSMTGRWPPCSTTPTMRCAADRGSAEGAAAGGC
jgi:hypothetical protein